MKSLNIIFLSGAGGVGKTSVAAEIKIQGEQRGLQVMLNKSTTRASYAAMGVKDETQGQTLEVKDQIALQERIFEDYCDNLIETIDNAISTGHDILCVDRSPFDHAAYYFQLIPTLGLEAIERRMIQVEQVMRQTFKKSWVNNIEIPHSVFVWFFAYPTAWAESGKIEDGFRYAPAAKNYIWSLALQQMLNSFCHKNPEVLYGVHGFREYDQRSIEQRAKLILDRSPFLSSKRRS